jgi:hypothetical protein
LEQTGRRIVADLKNPKWIYLKGILFLLSGILASVLLVAEAPTLKIGLLLCLAIWCFCRFYYFAFYVIEHYVDSEFKFSGIFDFVGYCLRSKN